MKKLFLLSIATLILFFGLHTSHSLAQNTQNIEYKVLAPLPGLTTGNCDVNGRNCIYTIETGGAQGTAVGGASLGNFLNTAYNYIVGISIALAVAMVIYGGVQYATADAANKTGKGRETIQSAILGLLLVLGSFLILNTINSDLTRFDLGLNYGMLPEVPNQSAGTTNPNNPGGTGTGTPARPTRPPTGVGQWTAEKAALAINDGDERAAYAAAGIEVKTNRCTTAMFEQYLNTKRPNCTAMGNMPGSVLTMLTTLKRDCGNCSIMVTGGTEWGHSTTSRYPHFPDSAVADLRYGDSKFDTFIKTKGKHAGACYGGQAWTVTASNGQTALFCDEAPPGGSRHWHVIFN